MNIVIVSPGMAHDGNTLKERSLGGSETAAIQLAESFAKKKDPFGSENRVIVFSPCERPLVVNKVSYLPMQLGREYLMSGDMDMLIVSRWQDPLMFPHNAKVCFYWGHDLALTRFAAPMRGIAYQVDRILLMSEFQKKQYEEIYGFPPEMHEVIRNGIDLSLFPAPYSRERVPGQMVYTARPERGLENLVKPGGIMQRLLEAKAPVKLMVAHYDNTTEQMKPYYEMLWQRCRELPNVKLLGSLTKEALYDLYSRSWAYVYPTEFEEISCITAMEAMACGLPFITTPVAALTETLHKDAVKFIDVKAPTPEGTQAFCNEINWLYNDQKRWGKMSGSGYAHASGLGWDPVADRLISLADGIMREKSSSPERLYKHFFRMSDVEMCRKIEKDFPADALELAAPEIEYVKKNFSFTESPEAYREQYRKVDGPIEGTKHGGAQVSQWDGSDNEPRWRTLRDFLLANKGKYKRILDYGCWIGHQTIRVANLLPDADVVGVDVTARNIDLANECKEKYAKGNNVRFEMTDEMGYGPLSNGGFDLVLCNEVLEHVLDPDLLLKLLEIECAQGGTIFLTTPAGPWEFQSYSSFPYRCHVRHYEMQDLIDLFGKKKDFQAFYKYVGQDPDGAPLGHHYVTFTNDKDVPNGEVNVVRKMTYQAPRETVSVCMIAYNAEDMLHRCLKSVRGLADEIIIAVDPKTNDSTREIAAKYGAKVIEGIDPLDPKQRGFEAARNRSIADAKGDWILWIDSDEELLQWRNLPKYFRRNCLNGYGLAQHHLSVDPPAAMKPDMPMRLFRSDKGIRFFGICHEHPELALNQGVGQGVVLADAWIAHDGYLTEKIRRERFLRNIDLVMRDREAYPERVLGHFLMLRDFLHLCRYRSEQRNGQGMDEQMAGWARSAVALFEEKYLTDVKNPMTPDALSYYSEANRLLGQGKAIKFMFAVENQPPKEILAQFRTSDHARDFMGALTKEILAPYEGRYL